MSLRNEGEQPLGVTPDTLPHHESLHETHNRLFLNIPFLLPKPPHMLNFTVGGLETAGQLTVTPTSVVAMLQEYPPADPNETHEIAKDRTPQLAIKVGEEIYVGMDAELLIGHVDGTEARGYKYAYWRKLDTTLDDQAEPTQPIANPLLSDNSLQVQGLVVDITTSEEVVTRLFGICSPDMAEYLSTGDGLKQVIVRQAIAPFTPPSVKKKDATTIEQVHEIGDNYGRGHYIHTNREMARLLRFLKKANKQNPSIEYSTPIHTPEIGVEAPAGFISLIALQDKVIAIQPVKKGFPIE